MVDLVDLSEESESCLHRSLEDVLVTALKEVREGRWQDFDGIIVIAVRTRGGEFTPQYERAGLGHVKSVTLLELTKHIMLEDMGDD